MTCPNCGLSNPDNARFCANCGTTLAGGPGQPYTPPQNPWQYQSSMPPPPRSSVGKNIAIGCLVAVLIVIFFGLSCTRACFRSRRYYRHYYGLIVVPTGVPLDSAGRLG
jgi:uncharacterized membrane protein YvbJ